MRLQLSRFCSRKTKRTSEGSSRYVRFLQFSSLTQFVIVVEIPGFQVLCADIRHRRTCEHECVCESGKFVDNSTNKREEG